MIDERLKTRDESGSTSSPTKRHPEHREGSIMHLSTLSLSKGLLLISFLFLAACTDYVQKMDDDFNEWEQAQQQMTLSSSSQTNKSSSSVKSSKSSSSVFLSGDSREKSSSSSKKAVSSSSNNKASSSSKKAVSSSSEKKNVSSNSAKSSSSAKTSSSSTKTSSSSKNVKSSSSRKASWAYLNPAISYGEMTDNRDGQIYKTVKIGEQTWMAENLNFETNNKSYCFNNEESNCAKYGRLYTWGTSMDSAGVYSNGGKGCGYKAECSPAYPARGICPEGWHLPSKEEWEKIFDKLKKENEGNRAWLSASELDCHCGSDKYGLSILGSAGMDYSGNNFGGASRTAFFQTSSITSNAGTHSYVLYINAEPTNANVYASLTEDWSRLYAFSVRCLKNSPNIVQNSSSSEVAEVSSSSKSIFSSSSSKASWAYLNPAISYGEIVDDRDGQVYKTVKIGEQTWMAENLSYKVTNSHCYKDSAQYCTKYGRYYTWTAAMDSEGIWSPNSKGCGNNQTCSPTYPVRGICAKGWHLPTEAEWSTLLTNYSGKILKSAIGWIGYQNGIDSYGFSVIPAGNKLSGYTSYNWGQSAYFWTSTEYNRINAYFIFFDFDNVNAPQTNYKDDEFSIRCIKD